MTHRNLYRIYRRRGAERDARAYIPTTPFRIRIVCVQLRRKVALRVSHTSSDDDVFRDELQIFFIERQISISRVK